MCGRFTLEIDADGLLRSYIVTPDPDDDMDEWEPSYSIAPSTAAPIVREHLHRGESVRTLDMATWGLQPAWAKDGGPRPINARFESIASNGMFRGAFTAQRAIVPLSGYFEWVVAEDGKKQPYYIHGSGLLTAAGLYAARKAGDGWKISFTIVTRAARDASGQIHDRMPVFLTDDAWQDWIAPNRLSPAGQEQALAVLDESSQHVASTLTAHPVDRRVNSIRTLDVTDPSLIDPAAVQTSLLDHPDG